MATTISAPIAGRSASDRYAFLAFAAWFFLVAIVGFGPNSVAILSGVRPSPRLVVHIHAAMMAGWLLMLLVQAGLQASGNRALHRIVGLSGIALATGIVLAMIAVTYVIYTAGIDTEFGPIFSNILLVQIRAIVMFPLFFVWALIVRKSDSETHKRLMLMATVVLIDAAIARITWLPGNNFPISYTTIHLYQLALLLPPVVYDIYRYGKVHKAFIIGIGLLLPWIIVTTALWGSPWWTSVAPVLMGAG